MPTLTFAFSGAAEALLISTPGALYVFRIYWGISWSQVKYSQLQLPLSACQGTRLLAVQPACWCAKDSLLSRLRMCWLEVDGLSGLVDSSPGGENNLEPEKHILCLTSWRKLKESCWSLFLFFSVKNKMCIFGDGPNYYRLWHLSFNVFFFVFFLKCPLKYQLD